jgi:tRNA (mo5U34)-methyltransferase
MYPGSRGAEQARAFIAEADFLWHQRFELVPGVVTPGTNDIRWLLDSAGVPEDLSGVTAVDIGTTNGGAAFELERRGAARVVAVDVLPSEYYGFERIREFLGSQVEWRQASIYELAEVLGERFDLVLCFGVLYHLRHPLLALDNVRALVDGEAMVETAVVDGEMPDLADRPVARFYRGGELADDPSNWFAPTVTLLLEWCRSTGFEPELISAWPADAPSRALVRARPVPGDPEWRLRSYELPVSARVLHGRGDSGR